MAWLAKAKRAVGGFVASLRQPKTIKKFLSFAAGVLGALIANGALSGQELVAANVILTVLTGAGIWSFSNAPLAP